MIEMNVPSTATQDHEEKLRKELKSTAERWRWNFNLPEKPNYDNVYYYKKSKKIFNAPCYDLDMDRPPENYKGEFLQVKNVLHQTEYRLRHSQDEAKKKKQDLAKQWQELETKEKELRENFIQFNKFLTRNITKRTRAEQKYQEMKALRLDCTKKIDHMLAESGAITEFVEKLKNMIVVHEIYEKYLHTVVMTGSFRNIPHIINRFILLEEAKEKVGKQMNDTSEAFHQRRMLYVRMIEISKLKFLGFSNELSDMRRKYDDAKNKTNAWEIVLHDICNKYAAAAQNISWSRMALRHLFDMAFHRIHRRRKRLIKTKKDDMGKMLRISETLKALERIESQLRKLQGQKNVGTSMDPPREPFEIKAKNPAQLAIFRMPEMMHKWMGKMGDTSFMKGGHQHGDLAGYLKLTTGGEMYEDVCPIKLAQEKWKLAKVQNFEEKYKDALFAIREEKLEQEIQDLTRKGLGTAKESFASSIKSRKSKWAAAAVAQKIAKDVTIDEAPLPTPAPSVMVSAMWDSALTVIEDADDIFGEFSSSNRRMKIKKLIESKFTAMLDTTPTRDREKQSVTLPSILSGYQATERDFPGRKTQELSHSPFPHAAVRKNPSTFGPDQRISTLANVEKLPYIYE